MPKFETIKAGDVLYDCRKQAMGNTTMRRMCTWKVHVQSIDPVNRSAMASWNGNPPRLYNERSLKRLRRTPLKEKS